VAHVPVVRVLWPAFVNYIFHESPNNAGHVAFSGVIAVFPLVLFLSSAANFLGEPQTAVELARTVLGYAPPAVAEALLPAIDEALGHRSRFALGLSLFGTLWAASSGAQALRMALNRAYGVKHGLSFWQARLKVLALTLVGSIATLFAFSTIVVLPYVWMLLNRAVGLTAQSLWMWIGVRYAMAFVVLFAAYCALYAWLPDIRQSVRWVVPGACVGVVLWFAAAALLAWTLRSAGDLTPIYGSFAGVIATLIFFYVSAVTVILGAEVNGVLRARGRRA
jgi:membrane protein